MGAVILNGLDANINMQHGLEQKTKVCEYENLLLGLVFLVQNLALQYIAIDQTSTGMTVLLGL